MVNAELGSVSIETIDASFDQFTVELSQNLPFISDMLAVCSM
jgi:hypothetical protein